jgi:uncharacterized protein involved in exopolysaccharide biosynthesis
MKSEGTDLPELQGVNPEKGNSIPGSGDGTDSMLNFLILLGVNKRTLIIATLLAGLIAAVISFLIPNLYLATTTLLAPQQSTPFSSAFVSQLGGLASMSPIAGGLGLKTPADLYVSLLKSRSVEDAMIQRFQLAGRYKAKRMSDAREKFEKYCVIEATPKDGLIRLSISDQDPNFAAEMTNAYVEEYRRFSANLAVTEASQRRLFLGQQLQQAKNDLVSAEENFKKSEQSSGMIQLDSQAKALIEAVASLRAQITAKEVQVSSLGSYETGSNPEVVLAKEQLAALQFQLRQLGGAEASSGSELIVPRGKIPEAGMDYARKLRDVKYQETIFEVLAKQYESAKLDEARQGAVIQVVDPAVVPDKHVSPKRVLIILGASLAGLLLGVLIVLSQQFLARIRRDKSNGSHMDALAKAWGSAS